MKRLFALLLAAVILLCLYAQGTQGAADNCAVPDVCFSLEAGAYPEECSAGRNFAVTCVKSAVTEADATSAAQQPAKRTAIFFIGITFLIQKRQQNAP